MPFLAESPLAKKKLRIQNNYLQLMKITSDQSVLAEAEGLLRQANRAEERAGSGEWGAAKVEEDIRWLANRSDQLLAQVKHSVAKAKPEQIFHVKPPTFPPDIVTVETPRTTPGQKRDTELVLPWFGAPDARVEWTIGTTDVGAKGATPIYALNPQETGSKPVIATVPEDRVRNPFTAADELTRPDPSKEKQPMMTWNDAFKVADALFEGWSKYEKDTLTNRLMVAQAEGKNLQLNQQQKQVVVRKRFPWLIAGAAVAVVAAIGVIAFRRG